MSLGIVLKSPSGIVLGADSRVTLTGSTTAIGTFSSHYDNAQKLLRFGAPNSYVGALTYGAATIGSDARTATGHLPEFEAQLPASRLNVEDFATRLRDFFRDLYVRLAPAFRGTDMAFVVAGYDPQEPYGRVFNFGLPSQPDLVEWHPGSFGMSWGGQMAIVQRLVLGREGDFLTRVGQESGLDDSQIQALENAARPEELAIPYQTLPLQDCVNLVDTLIRTTIALQGSMVTLRGVGGAIDLATITCTAGLAPVQMKQVQAPDG